MKLLGDYIYECCLTNGDTLNGICIKQLKLILMALVLDFLNIHECNVSQSWQFKDVWALTPNSGN